MRTEILDIRFPPSSTTTRKLPLHYQSYENGESFGCFGAAPKYITAAGQPRLPFRILKFPRNPPKTPAQVTFVVGHGTE
jgi:hypothetical protein